MANERARHLRKAMTPQEVKLWVRLREWRTLGHHFRRQHPIGLYVADFACLKHRLVVEVDGSQHGSGAPARRDAGRDDALRSAGFRILRFWNNEVDLDMDGVLQAIAVALVEPSTPPTGLRPVPPPRAGEG